MEAPDDHWIHKVSSGVLRPQAPEIGADRDLLPLPQLWGANDSGGQSNPALGHHLERSWPTLFGCTDTSLPASCEDDGPVSKEGCQCLDR